MKKISYLWVNSGLSCISGKCVFLPVAKGAAWSTQAALLLSGFSVTDTTKLQNTLFIVTHDNDVLTRNDKLKPFQAESPLLSVNLLSARLTAGRRQPYLRGWTGGRLGATFCQDISFQIFALLTTFLQQKI